MLRWPSLSLLLPILTRLGKTSFFPPMFLNTLVQNLVQVVGWWIVMMFNELNHKNRSIIRSFYNQRVAKEDKKVLNSFLSLVRTVNRAETKATKGKQQKQQRENNKRVLREKTQFLIISPDWQQRDNNMSSKGITTNSSRNPPWGFASHFWLFAFASLWRSKRNEYLPSSGRVRRECIDCLHRSGLLITINNSLILHRCTAWSLGRYWESAWHFFGTVLKSRVNDFWSFSHHNLSVFTPSVNTKMTPPHQNHIKIAFKPLASIYTV